MEKKITKAQMFAMIKAKVADDDTMVEFLNHEIELLDKKASYKRKVNDKKQIENDAIKAEILTVLSASNGMTSTEVMKSTEVLSAYSNQKISTMLHQLVADNKVRNYKEKKSSLFVLA
jgi:hypothetical protein